MSGKPSGSHHNWAAGKTLRIAINQAFEESEIAEICHAIAAATRLSISDLTVRAALGQMAELTQSGLDLLAKLHNNLPGYFRR